MPRIFVSCVFASKSYPFDRLVSERSFEPQPVECLVERLTPVVQAISNSGQRELYYSQTCLQCSIELISIIDERTCAFANPRTCVCWH